VGLVAVLATVISIAVGEGGPDAPPNEGFNQVQQLFGGIEQEGALLGDQEAAVLVTVYNDLNCDSCSSYQVAEIDPVIAEHAREGDVQFEFSHFSVGPRLTTEAALGATAAGIQARQWQYVDLLMRNIDAAGGVVDTEFLAEIAEIVPELDQDRWEQDRVSPDTREIVEADADEGVELRLPAEPVVIVTGPGGEERLEREPSSEEIEAAIEAVRG
jgi:protein-disulfide isomerase